MSTNYYKKTVKCECGCNYGSDCGAVTAFVLVQRNVSDTYSLLVNYDYNNPESKFESMGCFGNEKLGALIDLLNCGPQSPEKVTTEDILKTKDVY